VIWIGREPLGNRDGRVSLYLAEFLPSLAAQNVPKDLSERAARILQFLLQSGASFQQTIHQAAGGGFPNETTDAIWELVWAGLITNDTYRPVRGLLFPTERERLRGAAGHQPPGSPGFTLRMRARRGADGLGEGRWSAVGLRVMQKPTPAEWTAATAQQLLARYGLVMREAAAAEGLPGGWAGIYPAFKTMEESGRIRRGMFIAGLGAAQFATPSAVDILRSLRNDPAQPEAVHLAASDPANPYGSLLPWQETSADHTLSRSAGASVVLVNGRLAAFIRRRNPALQIFLPDDEPERSRFARALAGKLAEVALRRQTRRSGLLIGTVNGEPAGEHFLARFFEESGFVLTASGFVMRQVAYGAQVSPAVVAEHDDEDA
jgi:ATP-dependent Lhr-like helicase